MKNNKEKARKELRDELAELLIELENHETMAEMLRYRVDAVKEQLKAKAKRLTEYEKDLLYQAEYI